MANPISSIKDNPSNPLSSIEERDMLWYLLQSFLVLLLFASILLAEGRLQWTLTYIILLIIGINLIIWSEEDSEGTKLWRRKDKLQEEKNLHLSETSKLLKRTFDGMELSRVLLEKEVVKAFTAKFKEKKGYSQKELRHLLNKPEKFREIVDDEKISDFILSKKGLVDKRDKEEGEIEAVEDEKRYEKDMKDLIRRIETWE